MKAQRKQRLAARKEITPLTLDNFASLETLQKFATYGEVVQASSTGILLHFLREDFISKELRANLNIDHLVGTDVYFTIHEMGLEISGTVARTKFLGKKGFHIAIDYSKDAPEYWRECLMDLLP